LFIRQIIINSDCIMAKNKKETYYPERNEFMPHNALPILESFLAISINISL